MEILENIFWKLPYELRNKLYSEFYPHRFRRIMTMHNTTTPKGYTFISFHKYKCIFIHIPKCAGLAFAKSLFGNFGGSHIPLQNYQIFFTQEDFNGYYKFAIVRNPWDRLFSAFNFLRKGGINKKDSNWARRNLSHYKDFPEFVKKWVNQKSIKGFRHFIPQYKFISDFNGKLLTNYIGYYEHLNEEFDFISNKLNIHSVLENYNSTFNSKKKYIDYYDEEMKDIVRKVYQRDIELFGYNFEGIKFNK